MFKALSFAVWLIGVYFTSVTLFEIGVDSLASVLLGVVMQALFTLAQNSVLSGKVNKLAHQQKQLGFAVFGICIFLDFGANFVGVWSIVTQPGIYFRGATLFSWVPSEGIIELFICSFIAVTVMALPELLLNIDKK